MFLLSAGAVGLTVEPEKLRRKRKVYMLEEEEFPAQCSSRRA